MFWACLCNFQFPLQVWPSKRSFTKAQWGQRWPLQANSADRLPHTQSSESVDNSFFHLWGHMLTIKRQRPLKQQCRLVRKASRKICNVSYDRMTTSSLRTRSTLVSEAFHADEMFHKHGPAPVSEKCVNESRCAEEIASTIKIHTLISPITKETNLRAHLYGQVWGCGLQVAVGIQLCALVCVVGSWGWSGSPCGLEGAPVFRERKTPLCLVSWARSWAPEWVLIGCRSGDVTKSGRSWAHSSHPSPQWKHLLLAPCLYSSACIKEQERNC